MSGVENIFVAADVALCEGRQWERIYFYLSFTAYEWNQGKSGIADTEDTCSLRTILEWKLI